LAKRLAEQDKKHQAELKKEWDEVSWLKEQLAAMQKVHADDIEKAKSSLSRTSAEAEKYKQLHSEAELEAAAVQKELDELKAKAETWRSSLNKINNEMASKFPFPFQFLPTHIICRHMLELDITFPCHRKLPPLRANCHSRCQKGSPKEG
jgi:chromosome condensin MukBEF ATPase and DNA-binding subunit MukB